MQGRYLAIDYGERRVGLAVSDPLGITARGLETVERPGNDGTVIKRILEVLDEQQIKKIVLGRPERTDDKPSEAAARVDEFRERLAAATTIPIVYQDERYSSSVANQYLSERGIYRGAKRREVIDQVAAEVILRDYLDDQRV